MEKKKLTINEIAKRANVSIATVSRIINGKKNVKPDTEQNVMNVIAQLEKEYGLDSRFLNRTNPFILVVAEFDSPVLNDFAAGVQKKNFQQRIPHHYDRLFQIQSKFVCRNQLSGKKYSDFGNYHAE